MESKEPVSQHDEEEEDHYDNDYLGNQRRPEVEIARLLSVLLRAQGEPRGLVRESWRERGGGRRQQLSSKLYNYRTLLFAGI